MTPHFPDPLPEDAYRTSPTLLLRIRSLDDRVSWKEFYDLYAPMLLRYAHRLGLPPDKAGDVLQDSMVTFIRKLPEFVYDPERGRFRNLLLTYAHRKALQLFRKEKRNLLQHMAGYDLDKLRRVQEDVLGVTPEPEEDPAWTETLMREAIEDVRLNGKLQPKTWMVFEDYVLNNLECTQVMQKYGYNKNQIYQIRSRVLGLVRASAAALGLKTRPDDETPPTSP